MPLPGLEHTDWDLRCLTVGPLMMNAYLLWSRASREAVLFDPGDEPDTLLSAIESCGCPLTALVCTHGHFDHISAAAEIQAVWDLPLLVHARERPLAERLNASRALYGFPPVAPPRLAELGDADEGTADEGIFPLTNCDLQWFHTPGHSPGHVIFRLGGTALVGDVIFAGSVGRTDLPGGDFDILAESIRRRVYSLDEETVLHSGHGPLTTVGEEMRTNPFVRA